MSESIDPFTNSWHNNQRVCGSVLAVISRDVVLDKIEGSETRSIECEVGNCSVRLALAAETPDVITAEGECLRA